ncbi:neuroglobin [Sinocyclocheilus grahami]|uniref:neuroglobin n=1 Tax=Sinocyclocheilus grahami TaxID=75366 RepID=UPI0007AD33B4|nr:PREDICTED: neuroglobin [Sinocyclocheilus grahami]
MEKLSEKDKGLIRDSWESLGKNKVPHGIVMFTRTEKQPWSGVVGKVVDGPVMLVIDAAVSHLDDLHSLEDFLSNLGRKHQAVGVKTQSFTVVGESLLYMLQSSLGPAYTTPLRQAWLNMYSIVVSAMTRGWAKNGEHKSN